MRYSTQALLVTSLLFSVSACKNIPWLGEESSDKKLPGTRISVLAHETTLSADDSVSKKPFSAPFASENTSWTIQNARPAEHLALANPISDQSSYSVGSAPVSALRITSMPVIADGFLYSIDGKGVVSARKLANPSDVVWEYEVPKGETKRDLFGLGFKFDSSEAKDFLGGNIAYANKTIFITTVDGQIISVDSETGKENWKRSVKLPIRSAPVYADGAVFAITSENRTYALSASDGSTGWVHDGINESTRFYSTPSPTLVGDLVVVPYSSGELFALERKSGKPRWGASLSNSNLRRTSLVAINDINATPIAYEGSIYAISADGVLTAYNIDTGRERWRQDVPSIQTPWAAGGLLFIVTTKGELVAVQALDGKVKWVSKLAEKEADDAEPQTYAGPVLAGETLYVASSEGELLAVAPTDGTVLNRYSIGSDTFLPPIVVENNLLTLNNGAKLSIWK